MKYIYAISFFLTFLIVSIASGCGVHSSNLVKEYNDFAIKSAKMGLWDEAIMRWKRILEIEPDNAVIHNNLAVAYESKREFEAAQKEYKTAMQLDPNNKIYRINYLNFKRNYDRTIKKNKTQESKIETQEAEF